MAQPFRRNLQSGNVSNVFLGVMLVIALLTFLYRAKPADPVDVQKVVQSALNNPEAMTVVNAGLKESPVPTNSQLAGMKTKVDELLVLEMARDVTGDQSLKTSEQIRSGQAIQNAVASNDSFSDKLIQCLALVVGLTLFVIMSYKAFGAAHVRDN